MTKFKVEKIKIGNNKDGFSYAVSISEVTNCENDEVILLPSEYNGETITHFGYKQGYTPFEERFHDYHHPSQGMEIIEEKYYKGISYIKLSKNVKKVVIPDTICDVCFFAFSEVENINEIDFPLDNHPHLKTAIICGKKCVVSKTSKV